MTLWGLHLGPMLLVLMLAVNVVGIAYLGYRMRVLGLRQQRMTGLLISHGWMAGDPSAGEHAESALRATL